MIVTFARFHGCDARMNGTGSPKGGSGIYRDQHYNERNQVIALCCLELRLSKSVKDMLRLFGVAVWKHNKIS